MALENGDVLNNILTRLPAEPFANATCVNKLWNNVSKRILSRPKLVSALSLNSDLESAQKEVLNKCLSKPIRPDFAIAYIGSKFDLDVVHNELAKKLGSITPLVTTTAKGIIGRDVLTNEFKEINWDDEDRDDKFKKGIVLIIGFVPGLKVDAIPLLRPKLGSEAMVEKFVIDVKSYAVSVSNSTIPAAILLFGGKDVNIAPVLTDIDYAMPEETVIVGEAGGRFLCKSSMNARCYFSNMCVLDAVGLVFVKDKDKSNDVGETQFHLAMAAGINPLGPELRIVDVSVEPFYSRITTIMEGMNQIINAHGLLDALQEMMDDESPEMYIAVARSRRYYNGMNNWGDIRRYLTYYRIIKGEGQQFFIDASDILPLEKFIFYHSDSELASNSCTDASEHLGIIKDDLNNHYIRNLARKDDHGVFGGFLFSSRARGESFFGESNADSSTFVGNFPGATLAGMFGKREIGRSSSSALMREEHSGIEHCLVHVHSAMYLIMSYVPPNPAEI